MVKYAKYLTSGFCPSLRSVYFDTDKWKIVSVFVTNPLIKLTNKNLTIMEIGAVVCRMLGGTQGIARRRGEAR